jgi:taurine transport system permease protein
MRFRVKQKLERLAPIAGLVVLGIVWELLAEAVHQTDVFPSATKTLEGAVALIKSGFGWDVGATVARSISGWLISVALGVSIGVVIGSTKTTFEGSRPILAFLRCLPAFLLISVPISMGSSGEFARLSVVALASAWIITDECAHAVASIRQDKSDVLATFAASWWFRVRKIYLFEALAKALLPAARTSAAICFVIATVVESLAIPKFGVGARLLSFLGSADATGAFAFVLLTGLAGVAVSGVLDWVARKFIYWG